MNIESKIELVKKHKDDCLGALTGVLDGIYNITEKFIDENGEIIKEIDD